ncbi:MAG: hypothetical protein K5770_06320 [Lachnospiraceae bacterium]|nr:hypothetical protein [Lachnospiraceae bacterium]
MKKKDYEALCGRAYTESDIEKVFIVIGKYHNGKIRARTIEILGIDMPTALRMVEKNGIKIYQEKKLSTEKFANNEVMELIELVVKDQNELARYRLFDLFGAVFYKAFRKQGNLEPGETKNDKYWNYMAECMLVLDRCIYYYWRLYETGALKVKEGYDKPVDFSYILKLKLKEVPRTISKESNIIDFHQAIAKKIKELRRFLSLYKQENGGKEPSLQEIADALHLRRLSTAKKYLDDLHKTVISGDDTVRAYNSSYNDNGSETTVFDIIEDITNIALDSDENLDRIHIREMIKRLGKVKAAIVILKYGFNCDAHTDDEVAAILKLRKERYDRLLDSALDQLKIDLRDISAKTTMF